MCNNCKMNEIEKETRKLYHNIHKIQGDDPFIFHRMVDLLNTKYLKVNKNFFTDKICLDAGCGSNANATYSMLSMGVKKVHAMDLDETIFESIPKYLKEFDGKYEINTGSVLDLPYPDNFFDFTHCSGVLHSTGDVFRGFKELARVTKVGGILYTMTWGKGGLIREIINLLREKYKKDPEFKLQIDNLEINQFTDFFDWLALMLDSHDDDMKNMISSKKFHELFDIDLILTLKDRIITPIYDENSEEEIVKWLKDNGFTKIERLTRYPKYNNIRRMLSPVFYHYDSKFSKFLFGSGHVQIKAVKMK